MSDKDSQLPPSADGTGPAKDTNGNNLGSNGNSGNVPEGGDQMVSKLTVTPNETASHAVIDMTWSKPKDEPQSYEVTILESDTENRLETIVVHGTNHTVVDLEPSTSYLFEVVAVYPNGSKGKPTLSKIIKTEEVSPELLKVEKVQVRKDPSNPMRQIMVTWKKPNIKFTISHFVVFLTTADSTETESKTVKSSETTSRFQHLQSDTEYCAHVITVGKFGRKSKEKVSQSVRTNKAVRTQGFDIKISGKPRIKKCCAIKKGDILNSRFEWILPDLGNEKFNFVLKHIEASVKSSGETKEKVLNIVNETTTDPIILKWGKSFEFRVVCTYVDLDKPGQPLDAIATEVLNTDIGVPTISDVTWKDNKITVKWLKSKGANKYILSVTNSNTLAYKNETKSDITEHTFSMNDWCTYGKNCDFEIEAIGGVDKKEQSKKTSLLGGDYVARDVLTVNDSENPRRRLVVSWQPPAIQPKGYKVEVHEVELASNKEKISLFDQINPLEATQLSCKFKCLKTSTTYLCKVIPLYGGKPGHGSISNRIITKERLKSPMEHSADFGKVTGIHHETRDIEHDKLSVELSWKSVDLGENYRFESCVMELKQRNKLRWNSRVFTKEVGLNEENIKIPEVQMGYTYDAKFDTTFIDLDTKRKNNTSSQYSFSTSPSQTEIYNCTWEKGVVYFKWKSVAGAKKYQLIIKDEFMKEKLVADQTLPVTENDNGCKGQVQVTDKLGIGKVCNTKVIVFTDNNLKSETDFKSHLIGGELVPRNAKAVPNRKNPKRCVNIVFDAPLKGLADEYFVKAEPEKGRSKTMNSNSNNIVFEYLRKGIEYRFELFAKHGDTWSEGSTTNALRTDGGHSTEPMVNINENKGGKFDFRHTTYSGSTTHLDMPKNEDFGIVRNVKVSIEEKVDKDMMTLQWMVPSFDNKTNDFKVDQYEIEVRKPHASNHRTYKKPFVKGLNNYSLEDIDLCLSETYEITIITYYEDIDGDVDCVSNPYKTTINTRPCKPVVRCNNIKKDELKIEWNAVSGVQHYELEIFTDNSNTPKFSEISKVNFWVKPLDETFGYGATYYAIIRAIGMDNKTNEGKTEKKTIGGDLVPTNVRATINDVEDPNTQAFLRWDQPKTVAISYDVSVIPNVEDVNFKYDETSCLVSGLKTGTSYSFKVFANHEKRGETIKSEGCFSNLIQTNPTPTQIKNVSADFGDNRSVSIAVKWDKVDTEMEDEQVTYRVRIITKDKNIERMICTSNTDLTIDGLEPGTEYSITVVGHNSKGYGRDSDAISFTTALVTPKDICLLSKIESPKAELELQFSDAVGDVKHYMVVLYKHENQAKHEVKRTKIKKPGHIFSELQHNTEYFAKLQAVFTNGQGDLSHSDMALTAPSMSEIITCECQSDSEGSMSSREIYIEWKSDPGCNEHQVSISRGQYQTKESLVVVENDTSLVYVCQLEAIQYSIKVRSKNSQCYGDWSNIKIVELAPCKIENVDVELDKSDIKIQCTSSKNDDLDYVPQAYCEKEIENKIKLVKEEGTFRKKVTNGDNIITFVYKPAESATRYKFLIWAETLSGVRGKATWSNYIFSRPAKTATPKVENQINSSMDIEVTWKAQKRCNAYEVWICREREEKAESRSMTNEASLKYRCKSPGDKYLISVRSICDSVKGDWSDNAKICLTPSEVEFIEDNSQEPVKFMEVKWKKLEVKPECYVITLCEGQIEIMVGKTNEAQYMFDRSIIKPGALYYCTVAAKNAEKTGKATKSKYYRIAWSIPDFFEITQDDNDPSRCAKMEWGKPFGVNCFKLQIENNQSGIVSEVLLKENNYHFQSGIPGNTYTVRLFCGCDSRFDVNFITHPMIMKPEPPTDIKVIPNIDINGFLVEFKDISSLRKTYTVSAEPLGDSGFTDPIETQEHSVRMKNLVAGESYRIVVVAKLGEMISVKAFSDGFIKTIPGEITNLKSHKEDGCIVFEWDPLEIRPDNYKVQWRSCNERIIDEITQKTRFAINYPVPANIYSLRVMASNSAGSGIMSRWETFITDPLPPYNVQVFPSVKKPRNNCVVKFEDERNPMKEYKITARRRDGGNEITRVTSDHCAVIEGPPEGLDHYFSVKTIFCGKESKEVCYTGEK